MAIQPEKPKLSLQSGANLTQLKKDVKKITDGINAQKNKRTEINQQIASYRAKLETMGIHKKAADMAMSYMGWEPEKREGFDIAYAIVREAMGLPVSDDLFAHADADVTDALDAALRGGFKDDILAFLLKLGTTADADAAFKSDPPARDEEAIDKVTKSELEEGASIIDGMRAAALAEGKVGDDFDKPVRVDENGKAEPAIGEKGVGLDGKRVGGDDF